MPKRPGAGEVVVTKAFQRPGVGAVVVRKVSERPRRRSHKGRYALNPGTFLTFRDHGAVNPRAFPRLCDHGACNSRSTSSAHIETAKATASLVPRPLTANLAGAHHRCRKYGPPRWQPRSFAPQSGGISASRFRASNTSSSRFRSRFRTPHRYRRDLPMHALRTQNARPSRLGRAGVLVASGSRKLPRS